MFITDKVTAQIQDSLNCMEQRVQILRDLSSRTPGWSNEPMLQSAAERAFHVAVECVTDVGNDIIDALIMRDPGGYSDIVQVLAEEGVVTEEWFKKFNQALNFRQRLVRDYKLLTPAEVESNVSACADLFVPYADSIRTYLKLEQAN